jgi:hypothetical protein
MQRTVSQAICKFKTIQSGRRTIWPENVMVRTRMNKKRFPFFFMVFVPLIPVIVNGQLLEA